MGLSDRTRRFWYVWSWRIRYWWLDTSSGESARRVLSYLLSILAVLEIADSYRDATRSPAPTDEPVQALVWWVWMLIVAALAAAVVYATMPKQKPPAAQDGDAPSVEDGKSVIHHFGECWIENEFILAWKQVGTEAIKTKGGKK